MIYMTNILISIHVYAINSLWFEWTGKCRFSNDEVVKIFRLYIFEFVEQVVWYFKTIDLEVHYGNTYDQNDRAKLSTLNMLMV